ncbi:MAG TPA: glycoside hydrolase family 9 protein [Vicinamibacterales bacterium]|nr:glycoside hydrolase family 9 protein [Vicinamibacterales bacterium]
MLLAPVAAGDEETPGIHVNQVGWLPGRPKIALVVGDETAATFRVRRAPDEAVVFEGALGPAVADADSGDRVRAADFSALAAAGEYRIEVAGRRSSPFRIAGDVYQRALHLTMRAFYGQRCGTAVDLAPWFPGYRHGVCHRAGGWHASSGRTGPRASIKGWHDAGDYGRYVVNSSLSTGTLLWAVELFPERMTSLALEIPESGDRMPDVLDEIRWNLDWMASMQDDDGGLWHKQTSERFAPFVMPEEDALPSLVIGIGKPPYKSTCATAGFAAVAAIAARVYRPHDGAYAARLLEAARRAWAWTERHPDVVFANPPGVSTGEYGDSDCGDERLWAAAELWRTTGEARYRDWVASRAPAYESALGSAAPPWWRNVAAMGLWGYVLGGARDGVAERVRRRALEAAAAIAERTARHPYRTSLVRANYVWGSNSVAANYALQLLVADAIAPDRRFVEAALENLHYLLGRNPFSLSWVTGLGAHAVRRPHHRPSGADAQPDPWPGLLAGGPNARRQDPAMQKLPDLPPARMYLDDQDSYATNEIAINWNAPLVFVLAGVGGRE